MHRTPSKVSASPAVTAPCSTDLFLVAMEVLGIKNKSRFLNLVSLCSGLSLGLVFDGMKQQCDKYMSVRHLHGVDANALLKTLP